MSDPFEHSRQLGEAAVEAVCRLVDANELERSEIARFEQLVRHGYKFVNFVVRKDAREYRFEGDWLVRLFRAEIK